MIYPTELEQQIRANRARMAQEVDAILQRMTLPIRYYPMKRASSLTECREQLPRLCSCIRKSFAGVRWLEGGIEQYATWDEVDGL